MFEFSELNTVEVLLLIGILGTVLTFPLQDIITLGFYDITDLFSGMVATACIAFMLGDTESFTNGELAIIYALVSVVLILIKIFVVTPFRKRTENSTTFSLKDLEGKEGSVTTTITKEAMGEVMVYAGFTRVNKGAKLYESKETAEIETLPSGSKVLIMESKDNLLYVVPYENSIKTTEAKTSWNNN